MVSFSNIDSVRSMREWLIQILLFATANSQYFNITDVTWNNEYRVGKWRYIKTAAVRFDCHHIHTYVLKEDIVTYSD
jgi:hypothetical protein